MSVQTPSWCSLQQMPFLFSVSVIGLFARFLSSRLPVFNMLFSLSPSLPLMRSRAGNWVALSVFCLEISCISSFNLHSSTSFKTLHKKIHQVLLSLHDKDCICFTFEWQHLYVQSLSSGEDPLLFTFYSWSICVHWESRFYLYHPVPTIQNLNRTFFAVHTSTNRPGPAIQSFSSLGQKALPASVHCLVTNHFPTVKCFA